MNFDLQQLASAHPENLMLISNELHQLFRNEMYTLKQHFGLTEIEKAGDIDAGFNLMIAEFQQRCYNQMVPYESETFQGMNVALLNDVRTKLAGIIMRCVEDTVSWYGGAGAGGVTDFIQLDAESESEEDSEEDSGECIRIVSVEDLVYTNLINLAKNKGFFNTDWHPIGSNALFNTDHEFTVEQLISNQGWQLSRINYSFLILISLISVASLKQYNQNAEAKLRRAVLDVVSELRSRRIEVMSALAMNYREPNVLDKVAKVAADNVLISSRAYGGEVYSVTYLATTTGHYPNCWLGTQSDRLEALIRQICM